MVNISQVAGRVCAYLQATDIGKGEIESIRKVLQENLERNLANMDTFTTEFAQHEYILIKGFISPQITEAFCKTLLNSNLPGQRIDAKKGGRWSLYELDYTLAPFMLDGGQDPFSVLLLSSPVVDAICRVVGVAPNRLLTTKRWLNCYYEEEYIMPHKDTTGDFQALLCLTAPPAENGGQLVIQDTAEIVLATGDLLIFKPSSVKHWTLPLKKSALVPNPTRITAVCRFYIQGGNEPDSAVAVYDEDNNLLGYKRKDGVIEPAS